eukprot:14356-Eustigmatos_ZCMA.PRE.1
MIARTSARDRADASRTPKSTCCTQIGQYNVRTSRVDRQAGMPISHTHPARRQTQTDTRRPIDTSR